MRTEKLPKDMYKIVHDEQIILIYFFILILLAASFDLLKVLQFYVVMFFDVLFDHSL